eukprot:1778684-Karenia_brevis.AAC.1
MKRGYQFLARAARGLLVASGVGCEVFSNSDVQPAIASGLKRLPHPLQERCWHCGAHMHCVSCVVADIDQAFESVSSESLLPAWKTILTQFHSRFPDAKGISVRNG